MKELIGLVRKQYVNYRYFKAYTITQFLRELFLLPRDVAGGSGHSSRILNLALFVTLRCNAKCSMCNLAEILNQKGVADMPFDRIERLLDEVAPHRPGIILFGGEPFVRKDIVELVKAVKQRDMPVGLFTNGLLLNEELVHDLVRENLDYIAFSLQGTREVHDRILQVPGAYDKMVRNIELFVRERPRRTKVITHTTICEHNLEDLGNLAETSLGLGVDLARFGHPTFYSPEEGARCTKSLRELFTGEPRVHATSWIYDISGKEDRYYERLSAFRRAYGSRVAFTPVLTDEELRSWYSPRFRSRRHCLFAWRALFIYPNGDAYPCESISYPMGNVFEEGFFKVWNNPRYRDFRKALKKGLFPACARCCKL